MKKEHKCKNCAHLKKREVSFLRHETYCERISAYVGKDCEPCLGFEKKGRMGK